MMLSLSQKSLINDSITTEEMRTAFRELNPDNAAAGCLVSEQSSLYSSNIEGRVSHILNLFNRNLRSRTFPT